MILAKCSQKGSGAVFTTLRGLKGTYPESPILAEVLNMNDKELYRSLFGHAAKMACPTYGLPALHSCPGKTFKKKKGHTPVCKVCYATVGNYTFPSCTKGHLRRVVAFLKDQDLWTRSIIDQIKASKASFVRLHDSGDFFSVSYLEAWKNVVREVNKRKINVRFLAPTRTWRLEKFLPALVDAPKGLIIRPSALYIDQEPFEVPGLAGTAYTVTDTGNCPAVLAHASCADVNCRKCWLSPKASVSYKQH